MSIDNQYKIGIVQISSDCATALTEGKTSMTVDHDSPRLRVTKAERATELQGLVAQWKKDLTIRDGGSASRITWMKIKKISSATQQVKILEDQFIGL